MTRSRISMVVAAGALVLVGLLAAALFSPKEPAPQQTTNDTEQIAKLDPPVAPKAVGDYPVTPPPPAVTNTPPAPVNPAPPAVARTETPPAPQPAAPTVVDYTIKPGDMISKLASRNGIKREDIYAVNPGLNDSNASKIRVGTVIKLPTGPGATLAVQPVAVPPDAPTASGNYFARREVEAEPGDTAMSLAIQYYSGSKAPAAEIAKANPQLGYGFRCQGGERVILPAWGTAPAGARVDGATPTGTTLERGSLIPPRR